MGYANNVPEGHNLLSLCKDLMRVRGLLGTSSSEQGEKALIQLDQLIQRIETSIEVQPIYEERNGIQEKKRSRKITKKTSPMVRQHNIGQRAGDEFDRDRPKFEPSPTEQERNNGYKDIG